MSEDWSVLVTLRDGTTQNWGPLGGPYPTNQPDVWEWMAAPQRYSELPWPWDVAEAVLIGRPPPDVAVVLTTCMGEWALHEFPVDEAERFIGSRWDADHGQP